MRKKLPIIFVIWFFLTTLITPAQSFGAAIKNGTACGKAGSSTKVIVKGITKTYICTINPASPTSSKRTWTLKTCVTYWKTAQGSQKSIDEQRDLVRVMNEPDKSTYMAELDKSQADLNKVIEAIKLNHCRAGL